MRSAKFLAFILGAAVSAAAAQASSITFVTPTGATTGGQSVDSSALVVTGAGTVTVTLTNLLANPTSVVQNISDFELKLSTGQTAATISSSSGLERTVNHDQTFTDGSAVATGWGVDSPAGGFIHIDDLGFAGPAHTIIGAPDSHGNYSNANGSIAEPGASRPHNPFLAGPVTFTLSVPGVTARSTVTDFIFSYGTTKGENLVTGNSVPVPLPASAWGGLGLLGLLGAARVRRSMTA